MIVFIVAMLLVAIFVSIGALMRKMDERDAARLDHYIDHPEDAPEGFWDAWDEYMGACYPTGRTYER